MQIKEILHWGCETLMFTSDSARLDAEVLLSYVLNKPTTFLLSNDDSEAGFLELLKYKKLIKKRKEGVPVAYLMSSKEFYGLEFKVNKNVLIPRPDTEILVDNAISYIDFQFPIFSTQGGQINLQNQFSEKIPILLDVGTGSGCIPISILKNIHGMKAVATEISSSAIKVAKYNIKNHHLNSRIKLIKSDLLEEVPHRLFRDKDVIVTANLPYIPRQFQIHPSTKYEPDVALYGGDDGLDIYKRLVEQLLEIKPVAVFFELFEFQAAILATKIPGYKLKYSKNMTGYARVMMMERKN